MGLLRIALAICVFRAHSSSFGVPLLSGDIAVEIFFLISGFYMQMILKFVYNFSKMGKQWLQKFYINRYLRLLPIYIITLITTLTFRVLYQLFFTKGTDLIQPFELITALNNLQNNLSNILLKVFLFFTQITIFFQDLVMFLGVNDGSANFVADFNQSDILIHSGLLIPQAWTLGIEISFYLIAPFLLKLSTKKLLFIASLSLLIKSTFLLYFSKLGIYNYFGFDGLPNVRSLWGYRFFPFEISYFIAGALSYRFFLEKQEYFCKPTLKNKLIAYVLVCLAISIPSRIFNLSSIYWLSPILFVFFLPILFHLFKNSKIDRIIGDLSYPFYISHLLCLQITSPLEEVGPKNFHVLTGLMLTFVFSVFLIKINNYFELIRETSTNFFELSLS